jgi:hypothetical protein
MNQEAAEFASSIVTIGPERAAEMLGSMQYEHQRPVSKSQVSLYANEMKAGRFVSGTTIRVAHIDGRSKLLDGQHRLYAVIASGTEQVFTLLEEFAPDNDYIAWAYGSLDIGRRRAHADLYRAMDLSARLGLTDSDIDKLAPALAFMMAGLKTRSGNVNIDRTERVRLMELYAPYMRKFRELTYGCEAEMKSPLKRAYVIAVAMLTLRFSEPFAVKRGAPSVSEFWRGVAFDDKIGSEDPRKIVNRHLLTTSLTSASQAGVRRSATTAPYAARYIASCFNAYMIRETRRMIRVSDTVKIYGVPDPDLWGK